MRTHQSDKKKARQCWDRGWQLLGMCLVMPATLPRKERCHTFSDPGWLRSRQRGQHAESALLPGQSRATPASHTCLPRTWPQCEEVLPQDPESNKYKPNLRLEGTEQASFKKVRTDVVSVITRVARTALRKFYDAQPACPPLHTRAWRPTCA